MIPVNQTRTGNAGNCFAACLSSILEVPLNQVPDFGMEDDETFLSKLARFLLIRDLYYVQVPPNDPILKAMWKYGDAYHTVEGVSPRGGLHACVGRNGKIVFDPHPGAQEPHLVEVQCFGLLCNRSAIAAPIPPVGNWNPSRLY